MTSYEEQNEEKEIIKRYRAMLRAWNSVKGAKNTKLVRKAFNMARDAHFSMRRLSGEPYIYHPLEVARIVAGEIGLGETAIISALLHDVVEDNPDFTIEMIREAFGPKVAYIVDGLTKIKDGYEKLESHVQAENIKKMMLTLSDDVRVILIKLADRLHNMQTLGSMTPNKQHNIAAETLYLYVPLAHRLGLYNIKSQLEDLALRYNEPEIYLEISSNIKDNEATRKRYIETFLFPIKKKLLSQGIAFQVDTRVKSVSSIYKKMQAKNITSLNDIYDMFAVRIIIESSSEQEMDNCFRVYTMVSKCYHPKNERFRDWISTPKANGYQAIHTTVMGPQGRWVEVQIRTQRMHEIAERGYAAHWKYKKIAGIDKSIESGLDEWLADVQEILKSSDSNALNFLDNIKLTLYSDEIFVWTPKGHLKSLPKGSTVLDFAYHVHTEIGNQCIGVKVNRNLVPLNHVLRSGDQVEVITSKKSQAKAVFLDYVKTPQAILRVKEALKEQHRRQSPEGRKKLEDIFKTLNVKFSKGNIGRLCGYMKLTSPIDLFYEAYKNNIPQSSILQCFVLGDDEGLVSETELGGKRFETENIPVTPAERKARQSIIHDLDKIHHSPANCCSPLPGDEVIAYSPDNVTYHVHRVNCNKAIELMTRFSNKVLHARWENKLNKGFQGGIKIKGFDRRNMIYDIVKVVDTEMDLDIKLFNIDTKGEFFEAKLIIEVHNLAELEQAIMKIGSIQNVSETTRLFRLHPKSVETE